MQVEQISIETLIPYVNNARTHSDAQVAQIAASIKEFGFNNPVLIADDNSIIAGHGRVMAARKLGKDTVPAVRLSHLTEMQRKAYILADNKLALNADWDNSLLAIELADLKDLGFDTDLTGFSADEIATLMPVELTEGLTDEDEVPEAPVDPVTKLGDVWVLGKHRLMCGDSTSVDAVDALMAGVKADLVHTDPPYNVDYSNQDRPKAGNIDHGKILNDVMTVEEFTQFLRDVYVCLDVATKENVAAYIWYADKMTVPFLQALDGTGFSFSQTIIWKKPMLLGRSRYQWAHEPCIFAVKGSLFHTEDRTKTTVWDFGGYDKSKNVHPTQKPLFLPEEAINNSSKRGDVVLDLFGGSGSTLIACDKTGRHARLMELDPKYCDVIVKRWQDLTGKQATLEETGESFNELSDIKNARQAA